MTKTTLIVLWLLVSLLTSGATAAEEEASPGADLADAALIVIDVQAFYFPGGMVPLSGPEAAAKRAAEVIETFRAAGRPVIHVQHLPRGVETPDATGIREQYRIRPEVLPAEGEVLIGKHHANSFRGTELLSVLRELEVTKLVVVGMQTHMCVEAAVRAAADLDFEVTVVHDGCATRDLTFNGERVPAAQVHAAALAAMEASYATVISTAELVGGEQ
ncbi:MAG: cysteine hydrolase family protein [Thermoanaerobaculales bacterium]|jgi:nicotinamidase-related amidase|nr:cysteine hydrolase family protein [Thermoanaerobaculales bacterium]